MSKCQFEAAIKEMKTFIQERVKGKFVSADTKEVLQDKLDEIAKMELMVRKLQGTVRVTNVSEVVVSRPTEAKKDFRSEFKKKRPSAAKWVDKEGAKFDVATQAISDGTKDSTAGFVKDFYGDKANTGTYTKDDVVYLSTNGNRAGRVVPVKNGELQGAYKNIDKAIEAGAKFVADTSKHLANTGKYNVGEVELAEYLRSKGYVREDKAGYGLWGPGKAKEVVTDKLKIMNGTITDKDGKASIQVNSMEELRGLSEEFNKLMKELGMGPKTTTDKVYQDGFEMLEKAGIKFRPFKLTFKKELKSGGYGTHNTKSGNIDVATGVMYNRNPQGILLHEYAHRISSEKLDKFPVLRSKIEKLMEHARKNGVTGYGMTDRYEFIAETISNPKFQEKLSKVPSYEGKGIVETVKLVFSKLLERVTGKEASALTDGLDLIVRLAKAEVDEEVSINLGKNTAKININFGSNEMKELSNLAYRPFTFDGVKYVSVEHAYQSLKSNKGLDDKVYNHPRWKEVESGKLVKIVGNNGTYTKDNWNVDKLMKELIQESFSQNLKAREVLNSTKEKELTHTQGDTIWSKEFPRLLMEVRDRAVSDTKSDYKLKPGKSVVEQVLNEFDKFIDEGKFKELDNKPEGQMTDADWDEHIRLDTLIGRREDVEELVKTGTLGATAKKDLSKYLGDAWDGFAEYAKIAWGVYHSVGDIATKEQIEQVEKTSKEVSDSRTAGKDSYTLPGGMNTNKGQTEAINKLKKWYIGKDLTFLLKGRGGTGKTTVIGKAVKELGIRDGRVLYAAYTNKAIGVLEAMNKGKNITESSYATTAQILGLKPKFDAVTGTTSFVVDDKAKDPLEFKQLLVIDEASMLPNGQQKQIEKRAKDMGIKIIYMGDDVQLPPVNEVIGGVVTKTAKVFGEHIGKENYAELSERMRQGEESPILPVTDALAKAVVEGKRFVEADLGFVTKYDKSKDEGVVFTDRWDNDVLDAFVHDYRLDPKGTRFVHYNTATHVNTENKVKAIRTKLFGDKALDKENKFIAGEQITFNEPYYKKIGGDMVYKVDNSTEATITKVKYESRYGVSYFHGKQERIAFMPVYVIDAADNFTGDKYEEIVVPAMSVSELKAYREGLKKDYGVYQGGLDQELATVGHAYVITSHKSQGSTYWTVYTDLGNIGSMPIDDDSKLKSAYVATSRPSKKLVVLDPRASKSSIPRSKVALKEKDGKIKADQQYRKLLNGMKDC